MDIKIEPKYIILATIFFSLYFFIHSQNRKIEKQNRYIQTLEKKQKEHQKEVNITNIVSTAKAKIKMIEEEKRDEENVDYGYHTTVFD